MKLELLVGQTLDNKYKIERELGRGGMGTVYLATHVGTERPVAVKIIAPQFMEREEFVERFRREARAAGRLRHPNVVNVTDFGLSDTEFGRVAYLVMEYLDGCTLGEILEEEKKMPLSWSLDILEQVCSAVHQAHELGIIHRDLKPDNIWLEPNQRGGYTVKVLDFGIAKLEEHVPAQLTDAPADDFTQDAPPRDSRRTIAENWQTQTLGDAPNSTAAGEAATMAFPNAGGDAATLALPAEPKTLVAEAGTLIQSPDVVFENNFENKTAILPAARQHVIVEPEENRATKMMSASFRANDSTGGDGESAGARTTELTHVGAVLGTPLYMSPEQCRGERLSPRSDIYSLAVIAHQMLGGKTPFGGDFNQVMNAHKETPPPVLDAKKIPKKVKKIIHASLSKNPSERPQTAEAFASELRAQSEGIGVLLQRSFTIYSEHLPKFLSLSLILFSPLIIFTVLKIAVSSLYIGEAISRSTTTRLSILLTLATTFIGIFCGHIIIGTTTWIVTQILAMPLRPVRLRPALEAARRKWRTFAGTGLFSTVLTFVGLLLCFFGFPVLYILFALVSPVVMMESMRGKAALKRSKNLVMRSPGTTVAAMSIMFLIPLLFAVLTSIFVATSLNSLSEMNDKITVIRRENSEQPDSSEAAASTKKESSANFDIDLGSGVKISEGENKSQTSHIKGVLQEAVMGVLMLPFQILMSSFSSIVVALLYIKTRLVGGESMKDLLEQFEDDRPRTNWQKRIRARLEQSGRQTHRT